jgi:hypothetical protein
MYVKVVSPYDEGASRSTLFEATEVQYGTVVTHKPISDRDFDLETGIGMELLHSPGLVDTVGGTDEVGPWWIYRYAVWPNDRGGNIGLVTSGDLYILNNNGKTIERIVA